jgi:hypothetical protein
MDGVTGFAVPAKNTSTNEMSNSDREYHGCIQILILANLLVNSSCV